MTELYALFLLCLKYAPAIRGEGFAWVGALDLSTWDAADLDELDQLGFVRDPPTWAREMANRPPHLWEIVAPPLRVASLPGADRIAIAMGRAVEAWQRSGPPPGLARRLVSGGRVAEYRQPGPPDGPVILEERELSTDSGPVVVSTLLREDGVEWSQWIRSGALQ